MSCFSEQFPVIRRSMVRFARRGATLARVIGELHFDRDVRLVVRERIVYHRLPAVSQTTPRQISNTTVSRLPISLLPSPIFPFSFERSKPLYCRHKKRIRRRD
jgi:hypothetical protein